MSPRKPCVFSTHTHARTQRKINIHQCTYALTKPQKHAHSCVYTLSSLDKDLLQQPKESTECTFVWWARDQIVIALTWRCDVEVRVSAWPASSCWKKTTQQQRQRLHIFLFESKSFLVVKMWGFDSECKSTSWVDSEIILVWLSGLTLTFMNQEIHQL